MTRWILKATKLIVLVPFSLLFNENALAQWQFADETSIRFPAIDTKAVWRSFGDLDADGDVDIHVRVLGEDEVWRDRLWINNGAGIFEMDSQPRFPEFGEPEINTGQSAFGDIDGDGDVDMVLARIANIRESDPPGGQNRILINDGNGFFTDETEQRLLAFIDHSVSVYLWDVDYDDDLDIFVCNEKNIAFPERKQNRLYINNGSGFFTDETTERLPEDVAHSLRADTADVDGDGYFDIYVANVSGFQDYLWINDGNGFFAEETGQRLPSEDSHSHLPRFGDIDADGDFDIVVASENGPDVLILINNGQGFFAEEREQRLPYNGTRSGGLYQAPKVSLEDVDGDDDLDLLLAGFGNIHLFLNDGEGFFTEITNEKVPAELGFVDLASLIDLDDDGDSDLFAMTVNNEVKLEMWANTLVTDVKEIAEQADVTRDFRLHQNYPNPFNAGTRIVYSLSRPGHVTLNIFDARGRLVRNLVDRFHAQGNFEILWDGTGKTGRPVPSGIYFARMSVSQASSTVRMILVK